MHRVALVCEPPDGGAAEHVRQLALGLPAYGYEPTLIVPYEFAHLNELQEVCDVRPLPFRRDYSHPHDDVRALTRMLPMLQDAAVVHAHCAKAGVMGRVAARLSRRPAVYTPHGFPFVGEMSEARRRFGLVAERALASSTAALICVCEFERRLAVKFGIRPQRIEVVYNGCPPCPAGETAVMPEGLIVGIVAGLHPAKAIDSLLDAMPTVVAAVPDAKLVIVGNGPLEAELHTQAEDLGLEVAWHSFQPPAARYLRGFDLSVLSSAWEAFPIAVLEALACGIPQVVTAVGGTSEAVVPETGIVVPPRDPAALADAIISLLRDPQRRAEMSEAAVRRHAEHFMLEPMVRNTAAVYDRVLSYS